MIIDTKDPRHIYADEGKELWRKEDGAGPCIEAILGYHKFNDGTIRLETANDYEEKDITEEEKNKNNLFNNEDKQ